MMNPFLVVAQLMLSLGVAAFSARADAHPVVVELFTSQSCSSCPAADEVLSDLVRENPAVIALSCHVTYWNHLDWKDTLSKPECTARQRDYAAVLGQGRNIYTPQMVVNGRQHFVGSSAKKARRAISKPSSVLGISIEDQENATVKAVLPDVPAGDYELRGFGYVSNPSEAIKRGENSGKFLQYTNSVVHVTQAQAWDGRSTTRVVALGDVPIDGVVVLAQSRSTGEVLAAGRFQLP